MNNSEDALLFDGWSSGDVHYSVVYVSCCLKPPYGGSVVSHSSLADRKVSF